MRACTRAIWLEFVGTNRDRVLIDRELLVHQEEFDGFHPGAHFVLVDVRLAGDKSLRDDLAVSGDETRRIAGIGRIDLIFLEQSLADENVQVGCAFKRQHRARSPRRFPPRSRSSTTDHPRRRSADSFVHARGLSSAATRVADLLVGGAEPEQDAVVRVHLRRDRLKADRRSTRAHFRVDAGGPERSGVGVLVRVDAAVRSDQLIEETMVGLGPPVRLEHDVVWANALERGRRRGDG